MGDFVQNSVMANRQSLPTGDSHVKVLVVDDHPNTARMLARAISRLGPNVEVVSATGGIEALQHVEDRAADILITDMMMPEMTGMELIEKLNDHPATSPAVIFMLTAHNVEGVREIAQRLKVRQVISKPVHPEWIFQLISQTVAEIRQSKPAGSEPGSQAPADTTPGRDRMQEVLTVDQLLWEVAKKFQPQAGIKDQLLVIGKTDPGSKVRGDAMQLRQALRTLVWSAIQNTPKGGSVILSSENDSDMVKIFVRDTGYGDNGNVDNESIEQELEAVKAIAEGHGGDVTVETEAGKGTCFTLSLPLTQSNILLAGNKTSAGVEVHS
jgi:CheY-like chemotaxis protein